MSGQDVEKSPFLDSNHADKFLRNMDIAGAAEVRETVFRLTRKIIPTEYRTPTAGQTGYKIKKLYSTFEPPFPNIVSILTSGKNK
jgi:hypothetical protein